MPLAFAKMHGLGNSYIYLDLTRGDDGLDFAALARRVSDPSFGIGSDGVIAILPSESADFRMRMFNADGSEAEMCGNGIRCVGKFIYDFGLSRKRDLVIETGAGPRYLSLGVENDRVTSVRVNMGEPRFSRAQIPMAGDPDESAILTRLKADDFAFDVTAVSMGNPHCVIFVDEITDEMVLDAGPRIERHPAFPKRVNVEFARVLSDGSIEMRVWERGSGETMACGTGACAVGVAAMVTGAALPRVTIHLRGGDLDIEWEKGGPVYMTGPATLVCTGELADEWLRVDNKSGAVV